MPIDDVMDTKALLLDVTVPAVGRGFGHGLIQMYGTDGTLLATASQSFTIPLASGGCPHGSMVHQ